MEELQQLQNAQLCAFAEWRDEDVPEAGGVYAIWRGPQLLYVGASKNLRQRLGQHANGARGSNVFCLHVGDRLVLPTLGRNEIAAIGDGTLKLDGITRDYIRRHLSYRFVVVEDPSRRKKVERAAVGREWPPGRPLLNLEG